MRKGPKGLVLVLEIAMFMKILEKIRFWDFLCFLQVVEDLHFSELEINLYEIIGLSRSIIHQQISLLK